MVETIIVNQHQAIVMKKIKSSLFLMMCLLITNMGMAQQQEQSNIPASPRWVSEKGYWVVESNLNTPENSIVYFYTNDQKLIYTEKVNGVVLNTSKRKTRMKLKKILDKVVNAWETTGVVKAEGELTAILTSR